MTDQIQISIDREVYDQLLMLMVPPIRLSRNCWLKMGVPAPPLLLWVSPNNTTLWEQELERTRQGVYDSGGNS